MAIIYKNICYPSAAQIVFEKKAILLTSRYKRAYPTVTEIQKWLFDNGFERFAELFEANEIDAEVLVDLSDDDLKELGIAMGPRKKLLKAILANEQVIEARSGSSNNQASQAPVKFTTSAKEAERRQLTVLFVDLVGSSTLAGELDPEEMRDVITGYQNAVAGVVTRFDGYVAKYMGDGVLCYFGWPNAHEDDAERAVRAALEIVLSVTAMRTPEGEALAARAGIATGLVVVGDLIGEGAAQEEAVVGETPNIAARLQALADPGQVVIAETTKLLLGDVFVLTDLGAHELRGISGKSSAYVVDMERPVESRFEARSSADISAMVGRDQELALMMERWRQARQSEGQLVLLTGEAGIGKSRITRAMIDSVAQEEHIRLSYQCSPYHVDSSLYPVIQQLTFVTGIKRSDSNDEKLDKLEAVLVNEKPALIAALLGLQTEERYGSFDLNPQQQRVQTLQALTDELTALAQHKPILFVLEDAHWIDASMLELLGLFLDQVVSARVLMLITARPTFSHSFGGHPIVSKLALNRLGRDQVTAIVSKITGGKTLPDEILYEITAKTDGVPLFVEELTKTVLESGCLKETQNAYVLTGPMSQMEIPATLHDSLMARLDRLQPVKEVAQTAACIGREFSHALLAAISPLDEPGLQDALEKLITAELIFRRGVADDTSYLFKHALVRDAAYESLLKTRRRAIHARLVDALENSDQPAPELLAYHCEQCEQLDKAIHYWREAGNTAFSLPAYAEAIGHYSAAINLIEQLDVPAVWNEFELELQLQLAQVCITKLGYDSEEAAAAFVRANGLLHTVNRPDLLVPVRYGIWIGHYLRAEHEAAYPLVSKLVEDIKDSEDPVAKLMANRMMAATLISLGKPLRARQHLELALDLYQPDFMTRFAENFAQEPGIQIRAYYTLGLYLLGFPDQANQHLEISQEAAIQLKHVNTTCYGALHWCVLGFMNRNEELARKSNHIMFELAQQHGMHTWLTYGQFGQALLQSRDGDMSALERLSLFFDDYVAEGNFLFISFYKTEQVRELLRHKQTDAALDAYKKTLNIINKTHERWYLPELYRLHGEINTAIDQPQQAEKSFQLAISTARKQDAKSWELRASTSLAQLWVGQGEVKNALELLQPIYDWFNEGFDTPDLKDARTLLQQYD